MASNMRPVKSSPFLPAITHDVGMSSATTRIRRAADGHVSQFHRQNIDPAMLFIIAGHPL
jgi:hypothetical protein